MKYLSFFIILLFVRCGASRYDSVYTKPYYEMDRLDCDVIIKNAIAHNIQDQNSSIRVYATPYYPNVVMALSRKQQLIKKLSDTEFKKSFDQLAKESLGLYYDWYSSSYVDPRGNYVKNKFKLDSLLFLLTIENKTYPCVIPFSFAQHRSLAEINDWPCYTPIIKDMKNRIFLKNDKNEIISPTFIWGRKRDQLMNNETLFVMFHLKIDSHYFLEGTNNIYMIIRGFGDDIRLAFPMAMMK